MDSAKWYADGRIVCIGGKQDCAEVGLDGRAEKICEWHNSEVSALQSALYAEVKRREEAKAELMDERIAHVRTQADNARLLEALGKAALNMRNAALAVHGMYVRGRINEASTEWAAVLNCSDALFVILHGAGRGE